MNQVITGSKAVMELYYNISCCITRAVQHLCHPQRHKHKIILLDQIYKLERKKYFLNLCTF